MGVFLAALLFRLIPVLLARNLGIGLDDMFQYDMLARSLAAGNGFRWYASADLEMLKPYVDFDLARVDYDPVRGVETSFRAPLYPVFLSLIYLLVGSGTQRFFAARLAQSLLGAALAPLTYLVAKKIFPENERAAKISAWSVAAYPILLAYPLGLGTENPFFLLLLASFLFLLKAAQVHTYTRTQVHTYTGTRTHAETSRQIDEQSKITELRNTQHATRNIHPSSFNFLLSGFLLGLTALTRSVILPFAILAVCYLFYLFRDPPYLTRTPFLTTKYTKVTKEKFSTQSALSPFVYLVSFVFRLFPFNFGRALFRNRALLAALALALVISPWIIRNSLLHHKLTGIETSMGYNLYLGYHPEGNGSFVFGPSLDLLPILDDAERDQVGTQKAIQFIRAEPERFFPLAVNRLGFFFGLEKRVLMYFYGNNILGFIPFPLLLALFLIMLLPFVIVSVSAALGASLLRWNPPTILLGLLFFAYILPHVFILSEDRFHLALVPFFAILASNFWTNGWKSLAARWRASRAGKIAVTLAVLAALLLLLNWGLELSRDADKIAQLLGPNGNFSNYPY